MIIYYGCIFDSICVIWAKAGKEFEGHEGSFGKAIAVRTERHKRNIRERLYCILRILYDIYFFFIKFIIQQS